MPVIDSYEHSLSRSLAVRAVQVVCVLFLLRQTSMLVPHFCGIPSVLSTCSSQSTAIAQAGLKLDLVLGLQA